MAQQKEKLLTSEDEDQGGKAEEELIIVETPIKEKADDTGHTDDDEDEDAEGGDESHDGEETERTVKRTDNDHGDEDREAIRERRRREKQERRERREQAIKRNNLEMEFLRKRNDDLERRLDGVATQVNQTQAANIEAELAKAHRDFQMAEQVMAKAAASNNGEDLVKALGYRDAARDRFNELTRQKQQVQGAKAAPETRQPTAPAPEVIRHAQKFVRENSWYDPNGRNEDSAIVQAIDVSLANEGYDPKSEEYWAELRKRAAKRLPERFAKPTREADADDGDTGFRNGKEAANNGARREPRGGPAVGSGRGDGGNTSRGREFYLSPDRKQALVEAGVWDDPVLRAKFVKKYAEYDREAKGLKR